MLTTLASFIFILGVLIFIHELGHFLVAKKVGIKVEKFSLGFPPNIFSKKFGETTYCIGLIPLGGFIKMAGENPDEEPTGAEYEFSSKTVGQRAAVIFAGPFMNYILALVLMISVFMFGGKPIFDETKVIVGKVIEDNPAFRAGLQTDDIILKLNDREISHYDTLRLSIYQIVGDTLTLTWLHEGDTVTADIVTRIEEIYNKDGVKDSIGLIGFGQKISSYERFGFFEAIRLGVDRTHFFLAGTIGFVKQVIFGQVSSKLIGGPIFIAQQSGKVAREGAVSFFIFMALLSVNLAVLNVLPIPVLDGGHLLFLAIEKIKKSPVSLKTRIIAQQVGIVSLLSLILYVFYNDILRIFNG